MTNASKTAALTGRAQARFATIRAEISTRLWPVNAGMSSESFNELMDQMALLQLNFELRAAAGPGTIDTRAGSGDRRGVSCFTPAGTKSPAKGTTGE